MAGRAPATPSRISTSGVPAPRNSAAVASAERRTCAAAPGSALTDGILINSSRSARALGNTRRTASRRLSLTVSQPTGSPRRAQEALDEVGLARPGGEQHVPGDAPARVAQR